MERVGRYEVGSLLGRGGMGAVHRARDPRSGAEVALKILDALEPAELARFEVEARALARVRVPGLVELLEVGREGRTAFLAMELVPGETLQARLQREGPLPQADALRIALELARTLAQLHAQGVVHRDLKPGNVILRPDGVPVLLDLGLALLLDRSARLTRTGELLGTPGFMAPEQARGHPGGVGPGADVYALGALLHALLTGRPPFDGPGPLQILAAVLAQLPAPPSASGAVVDPRVDALVLRCLAKSPAERPPTAAAVAAELESILGAPARSAGPRRPRAAWLALLTLIPLGALLAFRAAGSAPATLAPGPAPPAPPRAPPPESARLLAEARAAWRAHDPERALARSQEVLRLEAPAQRAAARLLRALVLFAGGRREPAQAELELALAAAPDEAQRALAEGLLAGARGDPAAAAKACSRALELRPDDADAAYARAGAREALGDLPGAVADYGLALGLDPGFAEAWQNRAMLRQSLGDLPGALEDYTRGIEVDPGNGGAYSNRGVVRQALGDLPGAIADHTRAVELEPRLAEALCNLGNARHAAGDPRGALEDYSRALELEPSLPAAWGNRGAVRLELGDLAGAIEDYTRALELDPRNATANYNRGNAHRTAGDLQRALADYTRAVELDPGHHRAWTNRGFTLGLLGDRAGAVQDLERVLELVPPDSPDATLARRLLAAVRGD